MELQDISEQLSEILAEISASVERIRDEKNVHPLDKDLLLGQIRDIYAVALKIETGAETPENTEPEEGFEQDGPQTYDPSQNSSFVADIEQPAEEHTTTTEPQTNETTATVFDSSAEKNDIPDNNNQIIYSTIDETNNLTNEDFENQQDIESATVPDVKYENKDEEQAAKTTPTEPEPITQPEPHEPNVLERVMNRKNAIQNIVSQQHNTGLEKYNETPQAEPQPEESGHPQHNESQPQLSLLDYLSSGVSRVVEKVEHHSSAAPQKTAEQPLPENRPRPIAPQPDATPAPEPKPEPITKPVTPPEPQPQANPTTPKLPELRSLIGINDKFTFINDLFEKDMRNYNEFISTLNKIDDLGHAQAFVQQNATLHQWDKESMAVQLFMSVFKRRYSSPLILQ